MSSIMLEEYELMKDQKYRVYVSAVDKALKNFEYTSEWADLISALGKLNKVLLSHLKFPVIPRRIKISKRLAQCMHPALPSGVHLKALETYDVIFKCMGTNRLSHELFIYSAGLFPLLGHAAMNVRPTLLTVYETHFVPLGERLRPGLSGFLSGVLLGLEEGSDHFDRTNCLLEKVCDGVGPAYFYTCLWDCLASNSGIRLPAILFVLSHFNKKLTMEDQSYIMGTNVDSMVSALYIGVQDSSVLVQRSVLDLLLIGFPVHNTPLPRQSMVLLLTAALTTILRRDMSLNRRLFAWLLGTEVNSSILKKKIDSEEAELIDTYFHQYSKNMLIEAIKSTMKTVNQNTSFDLKPYRILVSLLDKPEIGPIILDDILYEVFRTFYHMCSQNDKLVKSQEVIKSANLLFSTLEPSYVWIHCGQLFEKACTAKVNNNLNTVDDVDNVQTVGSGMPNLMEICILTEFLLETVSVDAFIDTPSEHLPEIFLQIINKLYERLNVFTPNEIAKSLTLCRKILSKVQPMVVAIQPDKNNKIETINNTTPNHNSTTTITTTVEQTAMSPVMNLSISDNTITSIPLEKSQSDSKLNKQKLSSPIFNDRSPSPRRRANSSGTKKSDKKSKKKTSKSASKINELAHENSNNNNSGGGDGGGNNISVIVSDTTSNKSVDDSNIDYSEMNSEYNSPRRLSLFRHSLLESPINSPDFITSSRTPSPGHPAQKSLSEKCLRQYEQFYVKLISDRILGNDKTIIDMYKKLLILNPKKSSDEKLKLLETILNSRLNIDKPNWILSNTPLEIDKINRNNNDDDEEDDEELFNLYLTSVDEMKWDEVLKLASSLLVELSTFPTYFQSGDEVLIEEEPIEPVILPNWLQVLFVCSCWLSKQPQLQLTCIATLLDLIALFRAHNDVSTQCKNEDGVTTVIMEPLLKKWYISYLIEYTNVFQIISHFLWKHLGELPPHKYRLKCVELLYELNFSLYQYCDAVEDTIGLSLINSNLEKKIEAFNRFATLWHLGREIETNPRLRGCTKTFDKSLLKMLDNLQLQDNSPLKLHAQSWLIHSLVRGDIARVVDPLLIMLLDPSTCRMSILHVSIQHSNTVLSKNDSNEAKSEVKDDLETSAKIYAISSVDGNVIYHVSNSNNDDKKGKKGGANSVGNNSKFKKKPINPVKVKRIFAVTTLANTDKGNQYVTERNQFMKELEVPSSISGNYNISVFVNPMSVNCHPNINDSSTEEDVLVDSKKSSLPIDLLKNASRFKKPLSGRESTGSFDESLFESINSVYNKNSNNINNNRDNSDNSNNKTDFKKLSKDLTSSLDSITNSLESSSPELPTTTSIATTTTATNTNISKSQLKSSSSKKDKDKDKDKSESNNQTGGSREIAGGSLLKGKYVNNNEFSTAYEMHETMNNFDSNIGLPSWTMGGDEDCELDLSTTAEEYFSNSSISVVEEVLNEVVDKVLEICENDDDNNNNNNCNSNNNSHNHKLLNDDSMQLDNNNLKRNSGVGVHNLHSHMLLYCGVCDSSRTLYALRTLKNELITNTRMYLFAASTTAITSANKNTMLLTLLARHKKSVLGRNFYGDVISTKFIASYRSSMYLEVLILVCLYLLRSYYPNLGQMRLTQEEIVGNQQVQLASAELLTLIFSELVSIVRDSGKGFSCYIIDLLAKCKVQKIALHCLASSVLNMKNVQKDSDEIITFTEEIVLFNDPPTENDVNKCKYRASDHTEVYQMQLLRLVSALIMLEYQCSIQKGEDLSSPPQTPSTSGPSLINSIETTLEYTSGLPIPQQPLFLNSILNALQLDHMRHLHQHWTTLVTSSLPYMGASLTQVVTSVIHQLCHNIEHLASYYVTEDSQTVLMNKSNDFNSIECCLPADYTVTHLEALTFLLQYCLLDNTQQISLSFNQPGNFQSGIPGPNPGQIFNNLIHVFTPGLLSSDNLGKDKVNMTEQRLNAKRTTLSHLPRIIASLSTLWQAVLVVKDNEPVNCVLGNPRVVKHQLLELLSPISFHHGVNFLTAVAVAWHERRNQTPSTNNNSSTVMKKILPEACPNQQVIVHLVSAIRVMPIDTLVQTVNQVIKTPPPIQGVKQDFSLEVSVLELLYVYMQTNVLQSLVESWTSLLGLMKDGLSLTAPAQFLLLAILNEYIQKCPPMQEKKDIRDLQDISAKLIESCSQIAGACLEQTTWLRRNLAVREDVIIDVSDVSSETTPGTPPNSAYSVQAQGLLAEILSPLLDVSYGSQEKERVVTILINVMYNITPYLKNHSSKNISSFIACSQLLSSLSSYQYTRKAWRKDVLDLLLDSAFFQMTPACLPYWRTIIDNLMTHDNTTFRDLINRLSMAQSSGISIFSSKEQEYEQRSQLLKRLAFVIFCSETDQYHKYMPDIQERLADSLRLPQVIPSIQAQVFLCFRVLLLRMSPQHATSLWPVIVSELVQVLLHIEQELNTDTEEFSRQNSSHLKLLSALDSSWAVNVNNGLQAHGHPHWLQLQLAAAKLLDLALLLPAHKLPQFQMYRWAFVGNSDVDKTDNNNFSSEFIPHITRIARLMDLKFSESVPTKSTPGELILKSNRIKSLQELHYFFTKLSYRSKNTDAPLNMTQLEADIEQDFLEPMLTVPSR